MSMGGRLMGSMGKLLVGVGRLVKYGLCEHNGTYSDQESLRETSGNVDE